MKILLIILMIILIILKLYENYLNNNLSARIKFQLNGGSTILGLLTISKYVLLGIVIIEIILKFLGE